MPDRSKAKELFDKLPDPAKLALLGEVFAILDADDWHDGTLQSIGDAFDKHGVNRWWERV